MPGPVDPVTGQTFFLPKSRCSEPCGQVIKSFYFEWMLGVDNFLVGLMYFVFFYSKWFFLGFFFIISLLEDYDGGGK